ncbi:MAG: hypothetical protein KAT70_05365 [Thermoplasmata archaeon]|nr:hypothetical protein [Thermoplasmata archaeon]
MTGLEERLVALLISGDHPYTTIQLSSELHIPKEELLKALRSLEKLNYLHMAPLCPIMDIVIPAHRLMKLDPEEKEALCRQLEVARG